MANIPASYYDRYTLDTWFERDRAHVGLTDSRTGKEVLDLWDDDVRQSVEDGFLDPKDYHGSAIEYAIHLGLIPKARKNPGSRWHGRQATEAEEARVHAEDRGSIIGSHFYRGKREAHRESQDASRAMGLNPQRRKQRIANQIAFLAGRLEQAGQKTDADNLLRSAKLFLRRGDLTMLEQTLDTAQMLVRQRLKNPGAAWHRDQAKLAEDMEKRETRPRQRTYLRGMADAHTLSAHESRKMGLNPAVAYDVFLRGKKIDTVFQSGKSSAEEVKRGLVQHDGYDPDIRVVKQRRKGQNPASEADETAALELLVFIENSERLYRQQLLSIYANLDRKRKRGIYDREKAVKLFLYLADNGARLYNQEVMGKKGIPAFFTRATRLLVARDLRDRYETEERVKPNPRGARTLVGRVFKAERWAKRWARGRPIRKVKGGWQILAGRTRTPAQERTHRRSVKNPDIEMTFNSKAKAVRYASAMRKLGHDIEVVKGQYGTWKTIIHETRKNPIAVYNPPPGRIIYGRVLAVEAQKTNGSYRGKRFRHSFAGHSRVAAYAMPDGSVLLKSAAGKRLWADR